MTDAINARESIEALEIFDSSAINARDSLEILYNIFVTGVNARESVEVLWGQPNIGAVDARLSIEILESPILFIEQWGAIEM